MITFEDKEDIRSSNLPRRNRIVADDINQLKAHANRVQVFEAIIDYDSIHTVAVNDIGAVTLSNPSSGVTTLTFPNGTISDRVNIVQILNGEPIVNTSFIYANFSSDTLTILSKDNSDTPVDTLQTASITIKSYPAP